MCFIFSSFGGFTAYAQLGFCGGNSGDPIFTENFGIGTTNNPLPAGTTTYPYSSGFPNDGFYTVSNGTFGNGFDWHQIQDHTPGDTNGKCLIVNASFAAGEFYRTTVSGLCESTTYEFSAWIVNLVIANSFCSTQAGGTIPINVRFEIWDSTDSNLLASGNTGNIIEASAPNWQEFGLVFQTLAAQNAVLLKMINNGLGGCGNDVAIDDIEFKTCGDFISIVDNQANTNINICEGETPFSTQLTVTPDNSIFASHAYQWQQSSDNVVWTDIVGETNQILTTPAVTTTTFFRALVAEDAINLGNPLCNVISDVYQVTVNQAPTPPILECWEMATLNNATCSWDVSGTQPAAPTGLECWETATFNNTTCVWDVTGTQPTQPTLACWETATFNNTTCIWDVSGTQPSLPTGLECWEVATFNNITCIWDVTGIQPIQPTGLECWETATFNNTTCVWDITGIQVVAMEEENLTLCGGEDISIQANTDISGATYLWNTGATSEFITVNLPGTYIVESTDGCSVVEKTIFVEQVEVPLIEAVQSEGSSLIISTTNTGYFEYSIDGLTFQNSNVFSPLEGGQYTVYVRNSEGCQATTLSIIHLVIPKFFTPNGDGHHDFFEIKGIEFYNQNDVYIFDRYGKLLKSSKNQPFKWNGRFNGQLLATSDYWYIINIDGQQFAGHFTLKR